MRTSAFKLLLVLVAVLCQTRPSIQGYHVSCYSCHDCPEVLPHTKNVHRHSGCITCLKEVYYGITSRRCVKAGHVDTCVARTSDNLVRRCCNNFDLCNHSSPTTSSSSTQLVSLAIAGLILLR